MIQPQLLRLVLRPSLFSGISIVLVSLLGLVVMNWPYLTSSPGLYDFFYGSQGLVTVFEGSPKAIGNVQYDLFDSQAAYAVEIGLLAIFTAFIVFIMIHEFKHFIGVLRIVSNRYVSYERRHEFIETVLLRFILLILWAIYMLFSVVIIVPLCALLSRIGIEETDIVTNIGAMAGAFILSLLFLHGHVIFARLFRMRARVFGGNEAIRNAFMQ